MKSFKHILSLVVFLCLASACSAPTSDNATATALPTAYPRSSASAAPSETPLSTLTSALHGTGTTEAAPFSAGELRSIKIENPAYFSEAGASGGSSTFGATIDLSKSSPGMIIHLDFQDVSMANGSILALGSVELQCK